MDTMNLLFLDDYHDANSNHSFPFHMCELSLEDSYDFWFCGDYYMYPYLMWQGSRPSEKKIKQFLNTPKTVKFLRKQGFVSGEEYARLENNMDGLMRMDGLKLY